ncbi:tellurite resistance TerB family protein [Thiofilum flexile]|uniref:tellurite resistance TerB family protein n=1 Tax=Thiofilum flexile TaxID=125627 RepID=UPI000378FAC5|nr:tellurite resistance TerB family protein [Thiofilum flexile]
MDIANLVDQFLKTGKDMAQKGQSMAQDQLKGINNSDDPMAKLKTGAMAAGVLALLLGTQRGRGATSTALKVGSVTALAGMAYQMYQKWQSGQLGGNTAQAADASTTAAPPALPAAQDTVEATRLDPETLLKVMIAAAKADGHVDQAELTTIRDQLKNYELGDQLNNLILSEMTKPTSVNDIAALAHDDKAAAIEIYLVSKVVVGEESEAEKAYLAQLQQALGLPDALVQGV